MLTFAKRDSRNPFRIKTVTKPALLRPPMTYLRNVESSKTQPSSVFLNMCLRLDCTLTIKQILPPKKKELENTMELDYNISFIPAKVDGLNKIEEVQMDVNNIKNITTLCDDPQCEIQKSTVLALFNHFGISVDDNEHECSYTGVNCDRNNLVKYLFIENQIAEKTIPDSIAALTSLRGIFFGGQNLVGTIPSKLG